MPATLAQIRSEFRWDASVARWRKSGRFVAAAKLKRALVQYARNAGKEMRALTARMTAGDTTVGAWQEAFAARVKSGRLAMLAAAKGGFERLTAADYGRLGAQLRFQYARLQAFALDVEAGRLSKARILARADLYAAGFAGAYENARRDAAAGLYLQERRILHARESCADCLTEAGKGWVAAGTLRPIGDSVCRARCLCEFRFRNPD